MRTPGRRAEHGILIFGWLQLALGGLLLLSVPLAFVESSLIPAGARAGSGPPAHGPAVFSAGFNLLTSACFVVTGVGTLRVRRWAHALVLSLSKLWLLTGVLGLLVWVWIAPSLESHPALAEVGRIAPAAVWLAIAVATLVVAVLYVVLPAAFVLFFRHAAVRATFVRHDPRGSWVESLPEPVLAMTLTLALLAATAALCAPLGVFGLLGGMLVGANAVVAWLALATLLGYLTVAFARLRPPGWWGTLATTLVFTAGTLATLERVPAIAMLVAAGFPAEQVEAFEFMGLTGRPLLQAVTVLSAATVLFGLLRTRTHFRKPVL